MKPALGGARKDKFPAPISSALKNTQAKAHAAERKIKNHNKNKRKHHERL